MTLLDFDELKTGAQVGIQTTDRGVISGRGIPSSSLVTLGFIDAGAGNQSFNGDGSGGANQLASITTVKRTGIAASVIYNFLPAGVTTGALVFFVLEGVNAGAVVIQNDGDELATIDLTNPAEPTNPTAIPFPVLVFDGTNWQFVQSDFHLT